ADADPRGQHGSDHSPDAARAVPGVEGNRAHGGVRRGVFDGAVAFRRISFGRVAGGLAQWFVAYCLPRSRSGWLPAPLMPRSRWLRKNVPWAQSSGSSISMRRPRGPARQRSFSALSQTYSISGDASRNTTGWE